MILVACLFKRKKNRLELRSIIVDFLNGIKHTQCTCIRWYSCSWKSCFISVLMCVLNITQYSNCVHQRRIRYSYNRTIVVFRFYSVNTISIFLINQKVAVIFIWNHINNIGKDVQTFFEFNMIRIRFGSYLFTSKT